MLREGREDLRQDAHLNVVGDAQLALDALLGGRGAGQVSDVVLERGGHVAEGPGQVAHLVVALHLGQDRVQISGRDLPGGLGEPPQGPGDGAGDDPGQGGQGQEARHAQARGDGGHAPHVGQQFVPGIEHAQGPAAAGQGGIEKKPRAAGGGAHGLHETRAAADHVPADGPKLRVMPLLGKGEDGFVEHQGHVRVGHIDPALGDHEGVSGLQDAHLGDDPTQPLQGHVHGDHAGEAALTVRLAPEGHGVGGHEDVAAPLVEIGLGPDRAQQFPGELIPVLIEIAVGVPAEHGFANVGPVAVEIGGVIQALAVEAVGLESHGRGVDLGRVGQDAAAQAQDLRLGQGRVLQGVGRAPGHLLEGRKHGLDPVHRGLGLVARVLLDLVQDDVPADLVGICRNPAEDRRRAEQHEQGQPGRDAAEPHGVASRAKRS
jgi:hypothetical protein